MQIRRKKSKNWLRNSVYLSLAISFVLIGAGCASTHKTTTTDTTVTSPNNTAVGGDQQNQGAVEKSETTTTTTKTPTGHPGILSSAVHVIGWVIALPFRIIGGLIGWIF
jgi:hypothetical protein